MVHHLARAGQELHAAGKMPLTATLRYQCACANNEAITVSVVFDINAEEQQFIWTMQQLWRDVKTEIEQHAKPEPVIPSALGYWR